MTRSRSRSRFALCLAFPCLIILYPFDGRSAGQPGQDEIQSAYEEKLGRADSMRTAVDHARQDGDIEREALLSMELIAYLMSDVGDQVESYERALALETILEQNTDLEVYSKVAPHLYFRLGYFLQDQNNFEAARDHMLKAIELGERFGMHDRLPEWRLHLSQVYMMLDEREEALELIRRVTAETLDLDSPEAWQRVNEFRMSFHLHYNELHAAKIYGLASIGEESPSNHLAFRNGMLSEIYHRLNDNDSALIFANRALRISTENGWIKEEMMAHMNLRAIHKDLGDYERSVYHHEKYDELREALRSFETARAIGLANAQKAESERVLAQELADEKLASHRRIIYLVAAGLVALILLVIYIAKQLQVISNQKKVIEKEKLRAEHSERVKEQFLANMSHEIRTPMHAISGMINSLQRRQHTKEQEVYLQSMKLSANNLLVILNDILDMSKLNYGNLDIAHVPINLVDVCNQVVYLLGQKAREKGIALTFHGPDDFPEFIMGDPVRMNQILVNLVGNAIKFTDEGHVRIILIKHEDTYSIRVEDTGIGISAETLPNIFDQFRQGEGPLDKRYAGTGLGLSITKQLIELQHGTIRAESRPGEGSTFSFELPLTPASRSAAGENNYSEEQLKALGSRLDGSSILIAEDNLLNKMVLEDDLKWYIPNAKLTFVENGQQAIEAFGEQEFDIILMDVQMPVMNGYDAAREIMKMETGRPDDGRTPIIALTASLLKDQIDKCYAVGMAAYIPKPYTAQELVVTMVEVGG